MSVVSPTSRFAYKSFRLHVGRFAYTIKVVSPTELRLKIEDTDFINSRGSH